MQIDLKQLFDVNGETLSIDTSLDLSDYRLFGRQPIKSPVAVKGIVQNNVGVVTLKLDISLTLSVSCDRCLAPLEIDRRLSFEHTLVKKLYNESYDDYIVIPDAMLDLDQTARADIILELPSKFLCSDDCKGLCPICGKNLNLEPCGCDSKMTDPRLAALKDLLK